MIVFISTFLSHHQLPFCLEMCKKTNNQFVYIACEPINEERILLGYDDLNNKYPFVLRTYESEALYKKAKELCTQCDVLLIGSAPKEMFTDRLRKRKLTFRISERIFKDETPFFSSLRRKIGVLRHVLPYQNRNYYLLASSAYAVNDYASCGCFLNRAYKWGYFPETKRYDIEQLQKCKDENSILWVGRMLDWKHPDDAIRLAAALKKSGYRFHLKMIGCGDPMFEKIRTMVRQMNLSDCVTLLGALPAEEVRKEMEQSQIFLFSSDRREGWGAVVNEAMNAGCAIVANHSAGAVPYLISDGKNGVSYSDGNLNQALYALKELLDNPEKRRILGNNAYDTITQMWNCETAAERLVHLIERIAAGECNPNAYSDGVCSPARKNIDLRG